MLQSEEKWRTKTDSQAVSGMHPPFTRMELRHRRGWNKERAKRGSWAAFLTLTQPRKNISGWGFAHLWSPLVLLRFTHSLRTLLTSCLHPDISSPLFFSSKAANEENTSCFLIKSSPDGSPGNVALEESAAQLAEVLRLSMSCVQAGSLPRAQRSPSCYPTPNHMRGGSSFADWREIWETTQEKRQKANVKPRQVPCL